MKKDLHLTASVDKPEVLENIIEQLASRRYDIGYAKAAVPASWQALDTSSVEAYMSGMVEFDYNETQRIRLHTSQDSYSAASKGKLIHMI